MFGPGAATRLRDQRAGRSDDGGDIASRRIVVYPTVEPPGELT